MEALQAGGNAIDAAITAAAALAVLKPDACGLGADLFLIFYDARSGEAHALNASGPAPELAEPAAFRSGIPSDGLSASTVPGAVDGWQRALARFGRRTLAQALAPAIELANGAPVSAFFADTIAASAARVRSFPATDAIFYAGGAGASAGSVLVQRDVAETLSEIARDGTAAFYGGRFAGLLDAHARATGAFMRRSDLESYASEWTPALRASYRGHQLFGSPPVSIGIAVLEAMQILDNIDVSRFEPFGAEVVHVHVEAMKRALRDVRSVAGDPAFVGLDAVRRLLERSTGAAHAQAIESAFAAAIRSPESDSPGTDTSYIGVIDSDGNAVSLLQSVFNTFGCGEVVPGTGVLMNNRLKAFSLEPDSPNVLAPGKRPMNTLNPQLVRSPDGRICVFGTPGGPSQTFSNALLLMRTIDFGLDLQRAVDAPRWFVDARDELQIEDDVSADVLAELERRGHIVRPVPRWSAAHGGAGMVRINEYGVREAAADPRREGYALAR